MEKVAQVLEDGYQILSGAATQMGEASSNIHADSAEADFDSDEMLHDENINLEDFEEYGSPLMGMADSVMSDIMSYQVRWMIMIGWFLSSMCCVLHLISHVQTHYIIQSF